ncbi:hypothetical protein BS50DRAFT_583471 [Corynespora cassiicola Philippines]|uniref:RING-type domain-containing protein n=1 Tax=Corynespora cassiicola Philippines TaxID=1448308 RepID=A0A2T2P3C5_CORCC|nr:hypothetical protein BS50DRAFT_583471 [Corynespora cassiicola Philippines]
MDSHVTIYEIQTSPYYIRALRDVLELNGNGYWANQAMPRTLYSSDPVPEFMAPVRMPSFIQQVKAVGVGPNLYKLISGWFRICYVFHSDPRPGDPEYQQPSFAADMFATMSKDLSGLEKISIDVDQACREIYNLLGEIRDPNSWEGIGCGLGTNIFAAYFLSAILQPDVDTDGEYRNWLFDITDAQPAYRDWRTYERPDRPGGYGPFPALTQCFECIEEDEENGESEEEEEEKEKFDETDREEDDQVDRSHEEEEEEEDGNLVAMRTFVECAMQLACFVGQLFEVTDYDPRQDLIRRFTDLAVGHFVCDIHDLFSTTPFRVRHFASRIDFRNMVDALIAKAREIFSEESGMEQGIRLRLRLYRWVLQSGMDNQVSEIHRVLVRWIVDEKSWGGILTGENQRNGGMPSTHRIFESVWPQEMYDFIELTGQGIPIPEHMKDVELIACGPPIKVRSCAHPALPEKEDICLVCMYDFDKPARCLPVSLDACGHVFHRQCLRQLINGIQKSSNKCPTCRTIICRERDRQVKPEFEDEQVKETASAYESDYVSDDNLDGLDLASLTVD